MLGLLLLLPAAASNALPTRRLVSVTGTVAGHPVQATLQPDGRGGHWLTIERALQQGRAYVRFAVATPVLYRIAFRQSAPAGPSKVDEVLAASAFTSVSGTVSELAAEGFFPETDVAEVMLEFWAAAHGVASLMLAKPGLPWGDDLALAESLMRSVCLGRASRGVLGAADRRPEPRLRVL